MLKKFVLMAVACACVGSYTVAGAQGTIDVKPNQPKSVVAQQEAPMVGMPSPFHEFSTVDEAAKYMNITPQMPKVLPVGYNIESVSTIDKMYCKWFMFTKLVKMLLVIKLQANASSIA